MPITKKFTLTLTEDLITAVKGRAVEIFGKRKGAISHYVEMVLRNDLNLHLKDVEEN